MQLDTDHHPVIMDAAQIVQICCHIAVRTTFRLSLASIRTLNVLGACSQYFQGMPLYLRNL